ncbi:MAG: M23 family metallopeptidase [Alphaproteobacteria bacterium]
MKNVFLLLISLFICSCTFGRDGVEWVNYDWSSILGKPSSSASNPDYVTVKKGDTLYSLSKRYNVSTREIISKNNLKPPYTLYVGRRLNIPQTKYHIVAKGDTFYNISKRYNVEQSSLARVNHISNTASISIGQKLILPGSIVTSAKSNVYIPVKTASAKKEVSKPKTTWKPQPKTTTVVKPRTSKFMWPVKGTIIAKYGSKGHGKVNDGINIKAAKGTTIKAADAGTIAYAGNELKGFGNLILIKHSGGWITAYAHADKLYVKKGQKVVKGEKIATVGTTGDVSPAQLHFEVRSGKKALNPEYYLK